MSFDKEKTLPVLVALPRVQIAELSQPASLTESLPTSRLKANRIRLFGPLFCPLSDHRCGTALKTLVANLNVGKSANMSICIESYSFGIPWRPLRTVWPVIARCIGSGCQFIRQGMESNQKGLVSKSPRFPNTISLAYE